MKSICHGVIDFSLSINLFGILLFFSRNLKSKSKFEGLFTRKKNW